MTRLAPLMIEMDDFQDLVPETIDSFDLIEPYESFREESFIATWPTHREIAARAFTHYIRNGSVPGRCAENWRQAEQELRAESNGRN